MTASAWPTHEERERALWPERPQVGDAVSLVARGAPEKIGKVVATFYAFGDGMHVQWADDAGWCSWREVEVVRRAAPMPEDT